MKHLMIFVWIIVVLLMFIIPTQAQSFPAIQASDLQCTASTAYVTLPGLSVIFNRPFSLQVPAVIDVNVEIVSMTIQQAVRLRVLVDGVPVSTGSGTDGVQLAFVFFVDPDVNFPVATAAVGTRGFVFVTAPLSSGTHTVSIEWRVSFKSEYGPVCIGTRSLVVGP